MSNIAPANPLEMLAYNLSLLIEDEQIVYVGTGLPMVGAMLAHRTHAKNITMVFESGGQDPLEGCDVPWSVGCPFTFRKSPMSMEMANSFGQCALGYVDIAFQGGAQIDMYGNVNTSVIGSYENLKAILPGSGGGNDIGSLTEKSVLVGLQTPDRFPAKVDFLTTPGYLDGGDSREKAGLMGGPIAVVTQVGVYDFEPVSKRMRIKALNPGMTVEIAQVCTGFELLVPDHIEMVESPPNEVLEILRNVVDPRGVFTKMPGS
ncbi:MAG TPA: CoA-transferase [Syntrophomonadaceae bacterium]|nr:CoA-transferase [Syntrophomonadaceae bacterium]HRX20806.1 CoA-transferase [Syntrophomonadaceae bacterium]